VFRPGVTEALLVPTTTEDLMTEYHIQPMSGMVHEDPKCSVGTARYGTSPAALTNEETEALVVSGRVKACKRCYNGPRPVSA
jgi:hypothetical protein